jgi:hypothetical protein
MAKVSSGIAPRCRLQGSTRKRLSGSAFSRLVANSAPRERTRPAPILQTPRRGHCGNTEGNRNAVNLRAHIRTAPARRPYHSKRQPTNNPGLTVLLPRQARSAMMGRSGNGAGTSCADLERKGPAARGHGDRLLNRQPGPQRRVIVMRPCRTGLLGRDLNRRGLLLPARGRGPPRLLRLSFAQGARTIRSKQVGPEGHARSGSGRLCPSVAARLRRRTTTARRGPHAMEAAGDLRVCRTPAPQQHHERDHTNWTAGFHGLAKPLSLVYRCRLEGDKARPTHRSARIGPLQYVTDSRHH